ncbi:shikimate kinase [Paenibacillus sanguinis]|uniref:shikimate kinase n=1 Tax=Paenibacillus sanguinis TaxID=225906 RepID=UPI00036541FB|nr:shikimate kinase [Paenibacillus sanguinis]
MHKAINNIVLIGMMGTGKSTVGALLAVETGMKMVDLDEQIVQEAGLSIPEIFAIKGEAYFRDLESLLLSRVLSKSGIVLSTGGGAVLREANRQTMLAGGRVFALQATAEEIIARVGEDPNRPLLAGDAGQRIRTLLDERKQAYDFAHYAIDTTGKDAAHVAAEILTHYRG